MKTIEERAEAYAWSVWPNPMFAQEWEECKENYLVGATEQKAIDDAECVNKVLMGKGSSINCYKQGFHDAVERAKTAFGKTCGWLSTYPSCESWYNELFENFIKNMGE